jgi:hypothetical protein
LEFTCIVAVDMYKGYKIQFLFVLKKCKNLLPLKVETNDFEIENAARGDNLSIHGLECHIWYHTGAFEHKSERSIAKTHNAPDVATVELSHDRRTSLCCATREPWTRYRSRYFLFDIDRAAQGPGHFVRARSKMLHFAHL